MAGKMVRCAEGDFYYTGRQDIPPPKKRTYWLYPGEAQGLVYLREELVNTPLQVGPSELIEVGASRLVLVPFDTEKYPL